MGKLVKGLNYNCMKINSQYFFIFKVLSTQCYPLSCRDSVLSRTVVPLWPSLGCVPVFLAGLSEHRGPFTLPAGKSYLFMDILTRWWGSSRRNCSCSEDLFIEEQRATEIQSRSGDDKQGWLFSCFISLYALPTSKGVEDNRITSCLLSNTKRQEKQLTSSWVE